MKVETSKFSTGVGEAGAGSVERNFAAPIFIHKLEEKHQMLESSMMPHAARWNQILSKRIFVKVVITRTVRHDGNECFFKRNRSTG